jgi:CRP/FNR family transcriptional regulator, cyclic AMP receptor protein
VPAFDPKAFLATAGHGRTIASYERDDVIFRQGSPADSVYYLHTGKVKMGVTSRQGKNAVIAIAGPGHFFGESCLIGPTRHATAKAMSEAQATRIEKSTMARMLHVEPAFVHLFTTHLLTRGRRLEEDLVDQLFHSTEMRLGRTLLRLASPGTKNGPQPITTRISQGTLAEIVGTTRPRVSHFMTKFKKMGLISYDGHLQVHSSLLSAILRDQR